MTNDSPVFALFSHVGAAAPPPSIVHRRVHVQRFLQALLTGFNCPKELPALVSYGPHADSWAVRGFSSSWCSCGSHKATATIQYPILRVRRRCPQCSIGARWRLTCFPRRWKSVLTEKEHFSGGDIHDLTGETQSYDIACIPDGKLPLAVAIMYLIH